MIDTTLCYIENNGCYLMMHRISKKDDLNAGKWIGVGGKLEPGETPDECLVREVREETGLTLDGYSLRGIIDFHSDKWESEKMYLYTATVSDDADTETLPECDEGILAWIPFDEIMELPLWEGDRIFLPRLINGENEINMSLYYEGDNLIKVIEG